MLIRLTGLSARRPWLIISVWATITVAGFAIGTGVFSRLDSSIAVVPGSESEIAAQRITDTGPRPETLTAIVPASLAAQALLVQTIPGVTNVSPPKVSGDVALIQITLDPASGAATTVAERLHLIDPQVIVAGGSITEDEFGTQAQSDVVQAELISVPILLVLLLLVFGGMLAAGLPLLIAVVGVGGTFGLIYAFSYVSDVSVYSIQVITMLAIGLAVDYALLMVNRFREERAVNPDVATAIARTSASAGRTVLFSGLTVALALGGLIVFPDTFLRSMGFAGMGVVLVDMLAALTLLPALLALLGKRISPARPKQSDTGVFARVAAGVQRRPVVTVLAVSAVLVTLAIPALALRLSTGDPRLLPASTQTRQLHDSMAANFPELQRPDALQVVAETGDVATLKAQLEAVPGITAVVVEPLTANRTVLWATPANRAADEHTQQALGIIRSIAAPYEVTVGGDAARLADYEVALAQRIPWAAGIIIIGTLVLLFLFLGSIVLPIKAVLTNMLSIGAALGAVVWVFQQGNLASLFGTIQHDTTNITVPVLVGVIAFGLAIDYEVFLLSRIRERWLAGDTADRAVSVGLQQTGRIVTAAAGLLAVVFAGFLVGGFVPIKAIGLGLTLAVLLDATLVRMLLVPATMTLLKQLNWWAPGPLRRLHTRFALTD